MALLPLFGGCDFERKKALRSYDDELAPARELIEELRRYQPRVSEKRDAERMRDYVSTEILPRTRDLVIRLEEIEPSHPEIAALHDELIALWKAYALAFEELAEDLDESTLPIKRLRVQEQLARLLQRQRVWNAELATLADQH